MNLDRLLAALKDPTSGEGLRLTVYLDSRGYRSIGYGRNLDAKGISHHEADDLLMNDVAETIGAMQPRLDWLLALDDVRTRAFVELAFNLGVDGLLSFHRALDAARAGDWPRCGAELLDSHWSGQVQPPRRDRIVHMVRTGADQ